MLIHRCVMCNKDVINRIAADDDTNTILAVFNSSQNLSQETKDILAKENIHLINADQKQLVLERLFGKQ